ncbi:uncharacterized protein LOC123657924 [Melitaea cinxia]|uniref:uncharacterized protein LOC123657924 n=1 Tax=Melitaea cinxia TaxID=113334 RepID=UPI001E27171D|nr:uncharacterized protein LOC123657924 [Melitaea cinxia]
MELTIYYIFFILTLFRGFKSETTDSNDTEVLLHVYESYINASHNLDKSDRSILKTWSDDYQIQLVNLTAHYRLEMTRHKEHSIMIDTNSKWRECIEVHKEEINKAERAYYGGESQCLKVANAEERSKRRAVFQTEREIKKWRKSYKYLQNQCNSNYPDNKTAAGVCLVEYIQNDNYHVTFQRLILLKLQSMSDLHSQIVSSLTNCEGCLKKALSNYIDDVRSVMVNLKRCYSIRS